MVPSDCAFDANSCARRCCCCPHHLCGNAVPRNRRCVAYLCNSNYIEWCDVNCPSPAALPPPAALWQNHHRRHESLLFRIRPSCPGMSFHSQSRLFRNPQHQRSTPCRTASLCAFTRVCQGRSEDSAVEFHRNRYAGHGIHTLFLLCCCLFALRNRECSLADASIKWTVGYNTMTIMIAQFKLTKLQPGTRTSCGPRYSLAPAA